MAGGSCLSSLLLAQARRASAFRVDEVSRGLALRWVLARAELSAVVTDPAGGRAPGGTLRTSLGSLKTRAPRFLAVSPGIPRSETDCTEELWRRMQGIAVILTSALQSEARKRA